MASRFRVYIHSCGPTFLSRTMLEVKALLSSSAPRSRIPKIQKEGSTGLSCWITLRDLYILSHGLRTADDIMIQLIPERRGVGSLNKLIQALHAVPLHAYAPRILPERYVHKEGKLTDEEKKQEEHMREQHESHMLHNNIRVLIDQSILCNREVVRKFASETFRKTLLLRRGQTFKVKNVVYTDDPILFGKSEVEGQEIKELMSEQKKQRKLLAKQQKEEKLLTESIDYADFQGDNVENMDNNNTSNNEETKKVMIVLDRILDSDGNVNHGLLKQHLKDQVHEESWNSDAEEETEGGNVDFDDASVKSLQHYIEELRIQQARVGKEVPKFIEMTLSVGSRENTPMTLEDMLSLSKEEVDELEQALVQLGTRELVKAPMSSSLLTPDQVYGGSTSSASSNTPKSKASDAEPTIQSFLPTPYNKWKDSKIKRAAHGDREQSRMQKTAEIKVAEMKAKLRLKDRQVKNAVVAQENYDKPPAMFVPSRPTNETISNAMTLRLENNRLSLSLSAVGQQDRALYKRGWRTHIIETSLRETVAAGCLALAYEAMTPLLPTSPLAALETPEFTKPIKESFHLLADSARISRGIHDDQKGAKELQNRMVSMLTGIMGQDEAQRVILKTLVEESQDILGRTHVVEDLRKDQKDLTNTSLLGIHSIPKEIHQGLISVDEALSIQPNSKEHLLLQQGVKPDLYADMPPLIEGKTSTNDEHIVATVDTTSSTPRTSSLRASGRSGRSSLTGKSNTQDQIDRDAPIVKMPMEAETTPVTAAATTANTGLDDLGRPTVAAIIGAISDLPVYHQAQAAAALSKGFAFDPVAPMPSPAIVNTPNTPVHARDRTTLSEVLGYTLAGHMVDSDPAVRVFDPFCGSGTQVIESVFRFMGLPAPPLPRSFGFENWPIHNEYEYNAMVREWQLLYEHTVRKYVEEYGLSKSNLLKHGNNNNPLETSMHLDNFPLFIGSDLREKSISAAVHNAKSAGVNYFSQFHKADFESMISSAATTWAEAQVKQRLDEQERERKQYETKSESAIITPDDFAKLNDKYFSKPGAGSKLLKPAGFKDLTSKLGLRYPYLKGYTMIANVPWGVSDEKEYMRGSDRSSRPDKYNRGYVNTTQQEPVEALYQRLGATLYRHGKLFRDVFVLSAHHKFEKMTAIGAQRASIQDDHINEKKSSLMFRNQLAEQKEKPDLKWTKIASFYNQGVRTHLLKLDN